MAKTYEARVMAQRRFRHRDLREPAVLSGFRFGVHGAGYSQDSPDGNVLAGEQGTGAAAGELHFWRAPSWAEIEKAEAAMPSGQR